MHRTFALVLALSVYLVGAPPAPAQSPPPALTLATATKIADAAQVEATRNRWNVVIAVVDAGGYLIHLRRLDGTQLGSVAVAEDKARSAALFRRPTKAFADAVGSGRVGVLRLTGAIPIEGGVPLQSGDQVVGAIGVSGVTSEQDGQIAQAGARAFTQP